MKTFLIRSILGIFFGSFLAIILMFAVIYIREMEVLDASLFIKNSLGVIISGWFFTVSPLYFENPNLKLYQQTALHFGTVVISYFILAFAIGWIPFTAKTAMLNLGLFIVVYLIIWLAFYLYFRNQARKLNVELDKL